MNSSHSGTDLPQVTPFRFDIDLRREAVTADTTRREAADLIDTQSHAAGYAAGWAQGRQAAAVASQEESRRLHAEIEAAAAAAAVAAEARVNRALHALASAARRLDERSTPGLAELETTVVDSVFTLAEAVIGRELAIAETPGADAIARALAAVPTGGPVTVHLHPSDLATITEITGNNGQLTIEGRSVLVRSDPALQQGDAIAECDATTVDARIAPAVHRIREVLFGESAR